MSLTVLPPVDQVTDLVARARERGTVAMTDLTAAFDRCDLPDQTRGHQKPRTFGVTAAHRHDITAGGEPLDDITADKARPAEHRGSATSHLSPR